MADFKKVYEKVRGNEGYYSNRPNDRGGETYAGISRRFNPDWEGWALIDDYKNRFGKIKHNQKLDISGLHDLVVERYRKNYWGDMHGDRIVSFGIAANLFDFYINTERGASESIQRALRKLNFDVTVDGKIGPRTINAINTANPVLLNQRFNEERRRHYNEEAIKDPTQVEHLAGWLARVQRFEKLWK